MKTMNLPATKPSKPSMPLYRDLDGYEVTLDDLTSPDAAPIAAADLRAIDALHMGACYTTADGRTLTRVEVRS